MNKLLPQLQARVNVLALRERVLIFVSCTAVLFFAWNQLMFAPQHQARTTLNLQMQAVQRKLDFQAQEATVLAQLADSGTNQVKERQLAELEQENATLNSTLLELAVGLIPADDMLEVLKDVLLESSKLTIKRIELLPAEELKLNSVDGLGSTEVTGVMNHVVVLSLEGNYFELLRYLQGLEQLPWLFYWDRLDYTVSGYPVGDIELTVSTLTMEDASIGN
jgi:MSHA biogenesis protein MshJ